MKNLFLKRVAISKELYARVNVPGTIWFLAGTKKEVTKVIPLKHRDCFNMPGADRDVIVGAYLEVTKQDLVPHGVYRPVYTNGYRRHIGFNPLVVEHISGGYRENANGYECTLKLVVKK